MLARSSLLKLSSQLAYSASFRVQAPLRIKLLLFANDNWLHLRFPFSLRCSAFPYFACTIESVAILRRDYIKMKVSQ